MTDKKRVKTFTTMDDVLLHPGQAIALIERLRTQIYHMQKKLRKQRKRIAFNESVAEALDIGMGYVDTILTEEQSHELERVMLTAVQQVAKNKGVLKK